MSFRRWVAQLDLVALLLFAVIVELVLNRLAVPVLRPAGQSPPDWHRNLDVVGLFSFHLASTLALAVVGWSVWRRTAHPGLPTLARPVVAASGLVFVTVSAVNLVMYDAGHARSLAMEVAFVTLLAATLGAIVVSRADLMSKLGLVAVFLPFCVHFYATARLSMISPEEATLSELPDRAKIVGQHAIALAALLSPLLLSPRPFLRAAAQPVPMIIAAMVAALAAVVLRQNYEVGMELASKGLGVELGPDAPAATMALYVAAAAAAIWTVTTNLMSDSPARRQMGLGFALVVASGYRFAWPLAYLTAGAGFLAMCSAALRVRDQERAHAAPRFTAPTIDDQVWRRYTAAVGTALDGAPEVQREQQAELTEIVGRRGGARVAVRLQREHGHLECLDVVIDVSGAGQVTVPEGLPAWSMSPRAARLGGETHPTAARHEGVDVRTADPVFDRRFHVRERKGGALTGQLFDEGLRAGAAASLDGWLALWPGRALEYRLYPGRGAPLDHPVPVTPLAFRPPETMDVERLLSVIDLLVAIAARAPRA
jgi:hypothetical protein